VVFYHYQYAAVLFIIEIIITTYYNNGEPIIYRNLNIVNMQEVFKENYLINTKHKFPFEMLGKKWVMYVPDWEGFYAISQDCHVLSLARKVLAEDGTVRNYTDKILKPSTSKQKGDSDFLYAWDFSLSRKSPLGITIMKSVNRFNLLNLLIEYKHIDSIYPQTFPFSLLGKTAVMWLPGYEFKYAITDDANIIHLKSIDVNLNYTAYICPIVVRKNYEGFNIRKNGIQKTISRKYVLNLLMKK